VVPSTNPVTFVVAEFGEEIVGPPGETVHVPDIPEGTALPDKVVVVEQVKDWLDPADTVPIEGQVKEINT
jgi:hypothetical protein